jgi:hypothetical protein
MSLGPWFASERIVDGRDLALNPAAPRRIGRGEGPNIEDGATDAHDGQHRQDERPTSDPAGLAASS